ncbi:hypothetical protein Tco_0940637 [Tanacetum coccineum]|uniref:Uncharacterized protein n=1 Tax=Tanacetum coccineum TaxID=301880 RepID=A0ABQ5DQV5_9ASTR
MPYPSRKTKIWRIRALNFTQRLRMKDLYVVSRRKPYAIFKYKLWNIMEYNNPKMKVIKEESKILGLLMIDDDLFTCDTPLGTILNEFNRLSRMDDDLFTYEVKIPKLSYSSSVEQQMEDLDNGNLDVYERKLWYDECEKMYAEARIFINKRLVRLIDVTVEQWLL